MEVEAEVEEGVVLVIEVGVVEDFPEEADEVSSTSPPKLEFFKKLRA